MKKNQWNESLQIIFALIDYFRLPAGTQTITLKCDKEGNPSTDPQKVTIDEPLFRRAESIEDFEFVLEREFQRSKMTDKIIFQSRQLEIFKNNREILTKTKDSESEIDLIDRYIKFLNTLINTGRIQTFVNSFHDFLNYNDPESFAKKIKQEFISVQDSGKHSAALLTALVKKDLFKTYSSQQVVFEAMTSFFGNIGNVKGFNNYLNKNHNNSKSKQFQELIKDYSEKLSEIVKNSHY